MRRDGKVCQICLKVCERADDMFDSIPAFVDRIQSWGVECPLLKIFRPGLFFSEDNIPVISTMSAVGGHQLWHNHSQAGLRCGYFRNMQNSLFPVFCLVFYLFLPGTGDW